MNSKILDICLPFPAVIRSNTILLLPYLFSFVDNCIFLDDGALAASVHAEMPSPGHEDSVIGPSRFLHFLHASTSSKLHHMKESTFGHYQAIKYHL